MPQDLVVRSIPALIAALNSGGSTPAGIECCLGADDAGINVLQGVRLALALSHSKFTGSLIVKRLSSETAHVICEAVQHNTTLQSCKIDLTETQVSDETGAAMAEALRQNTTLQSCKIDLTETQVSDETGAALAEALRQNTTLQSCTIGLDYTLVSDETGVAMAEALRAAMAEALRQNTTLQSCEIYLAWAHVSDETGAAMAEALRHNTTLQSCGIDLEGTQVSDKTGAAMAEALRQNATLQSCLIGLDRTQVSDKTGAAMAEALRQNTTLQSCRISLFGTQVSDKTGAAMAEDLRQNTTLQSCKIYLAWTQVSDETGAAMAEALRQNTTLQSCTIGLEQTQVSDETGAAMAEALRQNTTLQSCTIGLDRTQVTDETGAAMAEALRQNTTLQSCTIGLTETQVSDETGAAMDAAISHALSRNSSLLAHRRVLLQLARWDDSTGFQSLKQGTFRRKILGFFIPPACNFQPLRPGRVDGSPTGSSPGKPLPQGADAKRGPEPDEDDELSRAIATSRAEASDQENSDLAAALIRSKADAMPAVNRCGLVLLRLTRCARTAEVADAIKTSAHLADCRAAVAEAGCELRPEWAGGAWILLPMTSEQFEEVATELGEVHILALGRDEDAVRTALGSVAKKRRPRITAEVLDDHEACASGRADDGNSGGGRSLPSASGDGASENVDLVVERAFVHFPLPREPPTSYSAPF